MFCKSKVTIKFQVTARRQKRIWFGSCIQYLPIILLCRGKLLDCEEDDFQNNSLLAVAASSLYKTLPVLRREEGSFSLSHSCVSSYFKDFY